MKYIFFISIIVSISSLFCQETVQYRLINADQLQHFKFFNDNVINLEGNVHFFYNEIEFKSHRAEIYEQQEYVTLKGNVVIIQDTLSITCDTAHYYKQSEYLRAEGNVVMTETHAVEITRKATSNQAQHYREKGEFILQGNVYAVDFTDSLYARAGFATYNQQTGYGYLIQRPVVWRAGEDSLALYAEKIEYYSDNKKMVASFNVITQNDVIKATSDFLIFYTEEEKMIYLGDPKFYSDDGDGNADLITVFLEDKNIKEILLEGNCFIEFNGEDSTAKDNWVSSEFMTLYYLDKKPSEFFARDTVKSFFLQDQTEKKAKMNNNVTGDLLTLYFNEESKIESLNIYENIKGTYRFEKK